MTGNTSLNQSPSTNLVKASAISPNAAPYVAKELIVKFKTPDQLRAEALEAVDVSAMRASLLSQLGATVLETTTSMGIERWRINTMGVEDTIALYADNPAIDYIEPNYIVSVDNVIPNDPSYDDLWGLNNTGRTGGTIDADIDAPEAGDIRTGSPDVVIGVIDTGVDYTHPDLNDNMWVNPGEIAGNGIDDDGNGFIDDVYGYDFANDDGDPFDDEGHGTHVAGTIAAEGNNGFGVTGVTWSAQIMALKFLDASGSGSTFDAIQAIEYATLMGADLTNNSWGGGGFSQGLQDAIAAASSAGQVFVAAAGNSGLDIDSSPQYPAAYNLDNIISVAATDDMDQLANFSNFGATSVDLAAPGVGILSTLPGNAYGFLNGTSMAAPHVSGVVALLLAENPDLTPTEIRTRLLETVDPVSALASTTLSGGRLNAFNALFAPEAADIQGTKWHDLNGNGIREVTEPGLAGWTMYLDDNANAVFDPGERFTLTDADGHYSFNFLEAGTYTVAEVQQPGWQQTNPVGAQTVVLAAGATATNIDFGNILASSASITGTKWHDLNENGLRESGEPGLANWTIYLDANSNGTLDSGETFTVTDINGNYTFSGLAPDTYVVAEVLQPGWRQTAPGFSDLTGDLFGEANDTLATAQGIDFIAGSPGVFTGQGTIGDNPGVLPATDVDLMMVDLAAGDRLTIDIDADQFGSGLDPILRLFDAAGNQLAVSDDTPAPGEPFTLDSYIDYTVSTAGTYYIGVSSYSNFNYDPTTPGSGSGSSTGNYSLDISLNNGDQAGTRVVTLAPGEVASAIDFGNVELPTGSITGLKWNDLDGDGERDFGEPGLANWTIYLDQNQNGQLDSTEQFTLTNQAGEYTFTDLPADTYIVAEVFQDTWQQTTPGIASGEIIADSVGDTFGFGAFQPDILSTAASVSGSTLLLEMTFATPIAPPSANQPESIVGFWDLDLDQDDSTGTPSHQSMLAPPDQQGGPLGVDVFIDLSSEASQPGLVDIIDATNDTVLGTVAIAYGASSLQISVPLALINDDGTLNYGSIIGTTTEFTDAAPDSAFGTLSPPTQGAPGPLTPTSVIPSLAGNYLVELSSGEAIAGVDFGNWQPVVLSGLKWNDINGNGFQDAGEAGLANWTVYLDQNQNGTLDPGEASTLTDAAGTYSFTVQSGTYTIAEVLQPGWIQTTPGGGSYTVSLQPGEQATTLDFGNQQIPATITGQTWDDLDGDGVFDPDEVGLAGWTIYLDHNQNGQLDAGEQSTTTGSNGDYSFTALPPGVYTVAEVLQPGWRQTYPGLTSSFETGDFTGWETLGDTRIETASVGVLPTDGVFQAFLTNGNASAQAFELEPFLDLAPGSLSALSIGDVTEGSAIKQTVTVTAGTELSFDWKFLTNELPQSSFNDLGFITITSETASALADTNSPLMLSQTVFQRETDFTEFSYTFTSTGTFTIGLGVVDVNDRSFDSALVIDNVSLVGTVPGETNPHTVLVESGETVSGLDFGNQVVIGAPPIAANDTGLVSEGRSLDLAVLANDSDPDGDPLVLTAINGTTVSSNQLVTLGSGSVVRLNADSSITYIPLGFIGLESGEGAIDSFEYTITDDDGNVSTGSAAITIVGSTPATISPGLGIFDLEQSRRFTAGTGAIEVPSDQLAGLPVAQFFDEAFYLNQYSDVSAVVDAGLVASGFDHFVTYGLAEGRNPSTLYNEAFYLNTNPDVAGAVAIGAFSSGLEHYTFFGAAEGRSPSSYFDELAYRTNYPDIQAAITSGNLTSGFEHYITFGADEGRLPLQLLYNEAFYLATNPDVAASVATGAFEDGFYHFTQFGQGEGRAPSTLYNEASYLALNPDVSGAVATGAFTSGFDHFAQYGRFENRPI